MTTRTTAVGPTIAQRWRAARWVLLALAVIIGVAGLITVLTAPRPGGPMDPESTSPGGARALVTNVEKMLRTAQRPAGEVAEVMHLIWSGSLISGVHRIA